MNKSIIVFLGLLVILLPIGASNRNIANANAIASNENQIVIKTIKKIIKYL
jgi:hypothetical protein